MGGVYIKICFALLEAVLCLLITILSTECSFSKLKIIKMYQLIRMETQVAGLVQISIQHKLIFKEQYAVFAAMKARMVQRRYYLFLVAEAWSPA
jgi:hypothetical protein